MERFFDSVALSERDRSPHDSGRSELFRWAIRDTMAIGLCRTCDRNRTHLDCLFPASTNNHQRICQRAEGIGVRAWIGRLSGFGAKVSRAHETRGAASEKRFRSTETWTKRNWRSPPILATSFG